MAPPKKTHQQRLLDNVVQSTAEGMRMDKALDEAKTKPKSKTRKPSTNKRTKSQAKTQKALRRGQKAIDFAIKLELAEQKKQSVEFLQMVRQLAISGLPRRPTDAPHMSRELRLGMDYWLRVTYAAAPGNKLPYGEDRFVLAGVQHLALQQGSPMVTFDRASELLNLFNIRYDGRSLRRLRERFERVAGLSIHLRSAATREGLDSSRTVAQSFIIEEYKLPSNYELKAEEQGLLSLPRIFGVPELDDMPYGVLLGERFWQLLLETKNRLLMPIDLLKMYIDQPAAWDFACFLVVRCGSAKATSVVPHDALMSLFKDGREPDRLVVKRLTRYLDELRSATGNRLKAQFVEQPPIYNPKGGRPKKQWGLRVSRSKSLLGAKLFELDPK